MELPPLADNPGAQPTAIDLVRRGWCVIPTLREKHPGVKADHPGLSLQEAEALQVSCSRFNVIIGRRDVPNRSGILDVETDGPLGEANLLAACDGAIPEGPHMLTPSGSVHRLLLWPSVPKGHRVRIGPGLLPKVDVPWQFLALDQGNRIWHDFDLALPDLPQSLYGLVVCRAQDVSVETGPPYSGDGFGTPDAVRWLQSRCDAIRSTPWEKGAGWNELFSKTVYGAAGLVAAGTLDGKHARELIFGACEDPDEAGAVFESAWDAGSRSPWKIERRNPAPAQRTTSLTGYGYGRLV